MRVSTLAVGFVPLVDAAPLIVAHEMGFAGEEGIALDLRRAPSWSSLRDMLAFGQVDAAHMLSPVPVAGAMGLGGLRDPLAAVAVLSANGNVFGVNRSIEARMRANGYQFDFKDAHKARAALLEASDTPLRIGIPFPFSMHAELISYWLAGSRNRYEVHTVPPPLMPNAIAAGEIDAFCVGEPWGSRIVDKGLGALVLPGAAIWSFAPEKVLATRALWADTEINLLNRLVRAVWRAGQWVSRDSSRLLASEILSRPDYLDLPAELAERALSGRLYINAAGEERTTHRFVEFHAGACNFPWRSQADWIATRLAGRYNRPENVARAAAGSVFRSDLFRAAMAGTNADLPERSSKPEGSLQVDTAVHRDTGRLILCADSFFDGRIFELPHDLRPISGQ